jgi:hypothetical protein
MRKEVTGMVVTAVPARRTELKARGVSQCAGIALLLTAVVTGCHPLRGCAESVFELESGSRLPRWFELPPGAKRADVSVSLTYYTPLFGDHRSATLTLRERSGRTLDEVTAVVDGPEPQTVPPHAATGAIPYPRYEVLSARGIKEVVEHRRMEPIFRINEQDQVRRKLGVVH